MNVFRKAAQLLIIVALLLSSSMVYASSSTIHPCSTPKGEQNLESPEACKSYVLGFLEGALLTDTAIIESFELEQSDFMKRVYQTRALRADVRPPSTYFAKICLPESFDQAAVVNKVLLYLDGHALMKDGPGVRVYEAFKNEYPCD